MVDKDATIEAWDGLQAQLDTIITHRDTLEVQLIVAQGALGMWKQQLMV